MKKVIMALCLIWSLAFVSCENWLDVKPKAEMQGCCWRLETHNKYLNQTLIKKF